MTPRMVYDFAHPIMGSSHIKMFREEAQRAADYLEYQIRGRLVKARHSRSAGGMWSGRKILPGFMVDCRAKVNEQRNPDFRKYKRFDLYADVILRYFEIFRENNGNLYTRRGTRSTNTVRTSPIFQRARFPKALRRQIISSGDRRSPRV